MKKAEMQRKEPSVGMYKSNTVLLIYEYGSSALTLERLKMFSKKPNFTIVEKQINNNPAIIMQYHWGLIDFWKLKFLDFEASPELSKFRYCSIVHFPNIDGENTRLNLFIYSNGDENDIIEHIVNSIRFPKLKLNKTGVTSNSETTTEENKF
jgi:hypothetical protein